MFESMGPGLSTALSCTCANALNVDRVEVNAIGILARAVSSASATPLVNCQCRNHGFVMVPLYMAKQ